MPVGHGRRRVALIPVVAIAALSAVAFTAGWFGDARVAWWQTHAPRTPFGVIERVEFRVDDQRRGDAVIAGGTLATWTDAPTVRELTALAPWTSRGLGYATRCTEGSPFHLVYITETGRELDVILPCDACPMAEPDWRGGRAGWEAPVLLTRLGELLAHEPAAQQYAEQFGDDERDYHAVWTYWAGDPWDVRAQTED